MTDTNTALAAPTTEQSSEIAQGAPARNLDSAALVSMRHLLVTDPKAHADTVIQVIDTMLAQASPASPQAGAESYPPSDWPYPESPSPAGWITNNTGWQRGDAMIYAKCWRPGGIPHPLDIPMFTLDQMNAHVDADRAQRRAATAALRARGAVPSGWKLVPIESSAAMQWAFNRAEVSYRDAAGRRQPMDPNSEFTARYTAMLAAAPQPPAALPGEQDADPLQGAANWLVQAHVALETSTLAGKLSIGYNRAERLHAAAMASAKGRTDGGEPA